MNRKTIRKTVIAVLALALVLALGMTAALADDNGSIKIEDGSQSGGMGRAVDLKITAPSGDSGTWAYSLSSSKGGSFSLSSGNLPSGNNIVVKYTAPTTECDDTVTVTFTQGSTTKKDALTLKTVAPTLTLDRYSDTYNPSGTTFTVTVKNPAESGVVTIDSYAHLGSVSGSGSSWIATATDCGTYYLNYEVGGNKVLSSDVKFKLNRAKPSFAVSSSEVTMYVSDTQSLMVTSNSDKISSLVINSSDSSVASTSFSNPTLTLTGLAPGTTTLTMYVPESNNYTASDTKSVKVHVLDPSATMISISPSSVALSKSNKSQTVTITVKNPVMNGSYADVNVKISKPSKGYNGVYIDGHRAKSGNTYRVTPSGGIAMFDVELKPKYSGTYTLQASNGSETAKITVTVTGYETLPKTGPDFTAVYVFAGLLAASLMVLAAVNIKRKKVNQ